jgi:hypothetical protein
MEGEMRRGKREGTEEGERMRRKETGRRREESLLLYLPPGQLQNHIKTETVEKISLFFLRRNF